MSRAYVDPPAGWERLGSRGWGPFVTREEFRTPGGEIVTWESRAHRKHPLRDLGRHDSTWFAPNAVGWWVGVLFMIGAACFALGAVPGYLDLVGTTADNVTYFIGSLFFTSAGFLQYWEVVNAPTTLDGARPRHRVFAWEPYRIDWWATAIQFVGTLYFNVSTGFALVSGLDATQANRVVWRPDAVGSICFLVASTLAWAEVSHGLGFRPRFTLSGWIAMLNLLGSVAFGVSAFAAKVVSGSGEPRNVELVNLGTFVGALCFLVGALLLLPERTEETATVPA